MEFWGLRKIKILEFLSRKWPQPDQKSWYRGSKEKHLKIPKSRYGSSGIFYNFF